MTQVNYHRKKNNMIIEALQLYDYIGVSKTIDIAKGINKLPSTVKEAKEQIKRKQQWKQKS